MLNTFACGFGDMNIYAFIFMAQHLVAYR